jgi:hypothetical protein
MFLGMGNAYAIRDIKCFVKGCVGEWVIMKYVIKNAGANVKFLQ